MTTNRQDAPPARRRHRRRRGDRQLRSTRTRTPLTRTRVAGTRLALSPPPLLTTAIVAIGVVVSMAMAVTLATAAARSTAAEQTGCPVDGLTVVAAPDISVLLTELAASYAATPDLACPQVRVVAKPTAVTAAVLERGWDDAADGPRPDVWIPESSIWSRILESRRPAAAPPEALLVTQNGPPVAYSPLVVALPELAAVDLGWTTNPPHWSELVGLATAPDGWRAIGHPEWGQVLVEVADPATSTVGIQSVIALAGAIRGLNQEDYLPSFTSGDPRIVDRLHAIRAVTSITAAGGPDLLAEADRRADEGKVTLFLVSEHDILKHNQTARSRLVAVYPSDGTPLSDYPYLLVGKDDMPAENRAAAAAFLRFLQTPATRDQLVAGGFRRGTASEGAHFNSGNGLAAAPSRELLPATGGTVLADLADVWNGEVR